MCRPARCCAAIGRASILGSGSDVWKYWDEKRAGNITEDDWSEIENGIARSFGTCMTMGTAATMMAIAEALGMTLPGASSIPAADANHPRMAAACGRRIVEMVWDDLTPDRILTPAAFDNAIAVHMALGGSTNAIIHLIAMARRAGIALTLARFDEISRQVPVIANIRPAGEFLMEDFYYAGGLRALMAKIADNLDLSCLTVSGQDAGRRYCRGKNASARCDPRAERCDLRRRRDRRADRQSRAARLRDEARGGGAAAASPSRPGARVRGLQRHGARDRARRSRRHARPCAWC